MRRVWKRLAGFVVVALVVAGGLVGCGLFAPKSAQDVFLRYAELSDRDNFVAKGTIGATLTVMGQDVPLTFDVQADVRGEAVHTTTKYKLFGKEMASESYVQKSENGYVFYTSAGTGDDAVWTKSATNAKDKSTNKGDGESNNDGSTANPLGALFLAQKVLDGSEFASSDTGYTVTVPGPVLLEVINTTDDLKNMLKDVDEQTLKNALSNAQVVFDFDKDCRITHLSLTMSMDLASTEDSDVFTLDMSLAVSADLDLAEYGSVTEEMVAVPKSVKEKATDIDDVAEGFGDIFGMNELTEAA